MIRGGDTAVVGPKTREERLRELKALLRIPDGLEYVARAYRLTFELPTSPVPPPAPLMIARILDREFPYRGRPVPAIRAV